MGVAYSLQCHQRMAISVLQLQTIMHRKRAVYLLTAAYLTAVCEVIVLYCVDLGQAFIAGGEPAALCCNGRPSRRHHFHRLQGTRRSFLPSVLWELCRCWFVCCGSVAATCGCGLDTCGLVNITAKLRLYFYKWWGLNQSQLAVVNRVVSGIELNKTKSSFFLFWWIAHH